MEKEKEKSNNDKLSDEDGQKKKIEKASYNVFAKYRSKRKMEEKEREEKYKKEKEEREEKERKLKEEREEKLRKEKEEREERERKLKQEREEKERLRKERREREEREREEKIRKEREEREEIERKEKEKKEEKLRKEKEEREERERERERERKEKEGREEKERLRKEKEEKDNQEVKKIGHYKSFKRNLDKKDIIEQEFGSTKGIEKEKKHTPFSPKSEKGKSEDDQQIEEEEEVNKEDELNKEKKDENAPLSFKERWKFRRPEAKKTLGKVIKEETESTSHSNDNNTNKLNNNSNEECNSNKLNNNSNEDNNTNTFSNENNSHKSNKSNKSNKNENDNNKQTNNFIPVQKIPGMSENLLNHVNRRINNIISKCSIPLMNVEDYILYKKIGEGSYGIIFSVISKKDKKQYALKKIISNKLKQIGEFTKEFELVHSCAHENIMKIYSYCIRILDPTTYALYVLMELAECDWDKEIKRKLKQRKNYSEKELINILYQLTSGLLYIQEKFKISHRDIKPQNVLVYADGKYKLADFGEAKEAKVSKQINTLRGTELYMSPALYDGLKNEKNDVSHNPFKSDVFSLGFCFVYASALNFNLLYEVRDILDSRTINVILHKFLNKFYSEKLIQLLANMLEIDESKRYDFSTIKKYIEDNYKDSLDN